jgi:hypothetical protein
MAVVLGLPAPGRGGTLPDPGAPTARVIGQPGGPPACYRVFAEGDEPAGGLPSHYIGEIRGRVTALSPPAGMALPRDLGRGGPVITGWITAFFPYWKDCRTGQASVPVEEFLGEGRVSPEEMLYPGKEKCPGFAHGPTIESLPGGLSKAPFRWHYLDKTFDMEFLGGFVGVAQDPGTLTLRPEIGWAVREARESV